MFNLKKVCDQKQRIKLKFRNSNSIINKIPNFLTKAGIIMIQFFLFFLVSSFLHASTVEVFSYTSKNAKSKIHSLKIHKSQSSKELHFTLKLRKAFVVEKALYDSIESQIQASKLQIKRREQPYLNPAESTLISVMASMDDKRPRTYQEAYDQYQTRQYNRVMNSLENPQNYYQNSNNNNNYFEKQVKTKFSNVLIPAMILGLKHKNHELYFTAEDKYDVKVSLPSNKTKNISYERDKDTLKFSYTPNFKFDQVSLAIIDDDDNMIEYLSNEADKFDYRGAWHLMKENKLLPFQKVTAKNLILKK